MIAFLIDDENRGIIWPILSNTTTIFLLPVLHAGNSYVPIISLNITFTIQSVNQRRVPIHIKYRAIEVLHGFIFMLAEVRI